jgi:hypothetical protein
MTRKNLKVSEIVHEELALRKRKEETFDDVLKRELDLLPNGVGDLVAFYPERMKMAAHAIVDIIEEQADLEREITEYEKYYALELDHPQSQHTIVQIQFHEDLQRGMEAVYRDVHGEMDELVSVVIPEEYQEDLEDVTGYPVYVGPLPSGGYEDWDTAVDESQIERQVRPKINGSYERWG